MTANLGFTPPLESQGPQTKAGNVLVFLGCQATHANATHDHARLSMQDYQSSLDRRQVRIPHLGYCTALALQALGIRERVLARQRRGVGLADGHTLRDRPTPV